MDCAKKIYESLNIVSGLTVTFALPVICYNVIKSICMRKLYQGLQSKVVVITGASSGLGEALAHEFFREGCQVVLCARRRDELERVKSELLSSRCYRTPHPPIIVPLDLTKIDDMKNVVKEILAITGCIDILINNGGISNRGSVLETKPEVDMKIMLVNYFGSVALTKAVLPSMIERKQGNIVFMSSIQGLIALPYRSSYGASKHAMEAFADSLRAEVSCHNISVTVVNPGYVKTNLSLNALTATGDTYGRMDHNTESGYTPEYVSEQTVKAVLGKKNQVIVASTVPKIAINLRKFVPSIYYLVMAWRAQNESQ